MYFLERKCLLKNLKKVLHKLCNFINIFREFDRIRHINLTTRQYPDSLLINLSSIDFLYHSRPFVQFRQVATHFSFLIIFLIILLLPTSFVGSTSIPRTHNSQNDNSLKMVKSFYAYKVSWKSTPRGDLPADLYQNIWFCFQDVFLNAKS